ncbi:phospholipid-translocating P-type ATPase, flippase [Purpureocillium lavendulum]|uniref:Phospholipid-translocating P-type ATPase, flippase n=1 Tax=Purpureocillium lavendulum TaxID=1247861 RepID=A0AB34G5Y3_9HYPO|nr:phospholipid-translocating P-type ATPase, flippase [Purpureocillium lavendulum]
MARSNSNWNLWKALVVAGTLASPALAGQILKTDGFSDCGSDSTIKVDKIDISYDNSNKTVIFDVAGSSTKEQNVTAVLNVTAYGNQVYTNSFNPCDAGTFIRQLCPVPVGTFSARGSQQIPSQFADVVPAIAFQVPDIAAQATLQLKSLDGGAKVACIQSQVSNGKTANVPAVQYVAAGVAGAALLVTGVSAVGAALSGGGAASGAGAGTISPSFTEMAGLFQGFAMNGMLSVNYPPIYRSFTKNFAFSTGLIPWTGLQSTIDSFRAKTGGNLTEDNVEFLKNATLIYPDGSTVSPNQGFLKFKRALGELATVVVRDIETSVNNSSPGSTDDSAETSDNFQHTVKGLQAYAERLTVPKSDVFMTALLVVAIVIAAIAVGILLVKVILEFWALFGSFPQSLTGFRKHYWGSIARTITSLILILYGIWVLYCIFQFTHGDSWAAKTLAGVTLAIFTGILAFFSWKIWIVASKLKEAEGDASALYEDKKIWVKYSLFYESYKKDYWWIFVPTIVYMFAKGCALAIADGSGMAQTISQLVIEGLMLIMLLWSRPYERKSGNVINIVIAVVRVLSVACILIFVEEFGIRQTTQTVAGVALIAVQSALTGILAILIAWNAINACCKANPHRKRRKEMGKFFDTDVSHSSRRAAADDSSTEAIQRDMDNLTPLDARNSLLLDRAKPETQGSMFSVTATNDVKEKSSFGNGDPERFYPLRDGLRPPPAPSGGPLYRPLTPTRPQDTQTLLDSAAPLGMGGRQPLLPTIEREYKGNYGRGFDNGYGYGNGGYRG